MHHKRSPDLVVQYSVTVPSSSSTICTPSNSHSIKRASPDYRHLPPGALFALAHWTFLDAAILSAHAHPPYEDPQIPPPVHGQFIDWVPGICSLLGMLIINLIDKDRIRGDDYGDSTAVWRALLFLLIGFAFMAGGLAGNVCQCKGSTSTYAKEPFIDTKPNNEMLGYPSSVGLRHSDTNSLISVEEIEVVPRTLDYLPLNMQPPANKPAPAVPYFTPAQVPAAGTAFDPQPNGNHIPKLFQPIRIRGTTFHNRIFLSPLAQYSTDDGHLTSWHMAHYSVGGIFTRGPGLSMIEATAVVSEGHVTAEDAGLWKDSQIKPLRKILAHAGWKASTVVLWLNSGVAATERIGGWPDNVWGPSMVPYKDTYPVPKEISKAQIKAIVIAFAEATRRALKAGIEKLQEPHSVSATEWLEEALPNEPSWHIEDTVKLAGILAEHGVDFLDVSSGGNHPKAMAVKEAIGDKLVIGFASDLGVAIKLANQIGWGFGGRGKSHKRIDW
ncbi:hypothetical protein BD769DRAFT_1392685 [Suillus cothurnatus]|nr:hypothetical protein BD769DRAFT_1392685 [Suillus cothurnatus]